MKTVKLHLRGRTFHQLYREWERERLLVSYKDVSVWEVERYGVKNVALFHRYFKYIHRLIYCTIHVRTNYRAAAVVALGDEWPNKRLSLNIMWRSWIVKKAS